MALIKQAANLNFAQGLDTKTDPKQLQPGKFTRLQNAIFTKGGEIGKRNGYAALPAMPDAGAEFVGTLNSGLTAIGTALDAYSASSAQWANKGSFQSVGVSTLPVIRNNTNQSQVDSAVAANGLVCAVYTDQNPASLGAAQYKYTILDSSTGLVIVAPTVITGADATYGTPRVFLLGSYFVIVYTALITAVYHLQYIAIGTAHPGTATVAADISISYTPSTSLAFDGVVLNNSLYLAWNGAAASGIKSAFLTSTLAVSSSVNPDPAHVATHMSVCADAVNQVIWVAYYDSVAPAGYVLALSPQLNTLLAPNSWSGAGGILNVTSTASSGTLTLLFEVSNVYSFGSGAASNLIYSLTTTLAGSIGSPANIVRSAGLASKAYMVGSTIYFLGVYSSPFQPTYFLFNGSGRVVAKLAYTNGGGYLTHGLPSVSVSGTEARVGYLFKDMIQAVNKDTNVAAGTQTAGVYSQLGINLATFDLGATPIAAEIGNNLNLTGGFLWAYDGAAATEQGFFLFPDSVAATTATGSGGLIAQKYFYQFTYEWTDNAGNAFRSAPSIPISITTTTASSTNTLSVPTLRLTYKTANPVKIVGYRWSTAQQTYYQFTSITAPTLNVTTSDSVTITDALSDSAILGNNILYTTGGVVEDVNGPAAVASFLYDDRLWLIDAEDPNLLWYSKQVIEATPVEMSDLLTLYVPPNTGAQGASGPLTCGAPMDDKAVLFKASSIQYFNGSGPDNTGANSQYGPPALITSTVGCSNQASIVFQPQGLMFEFASPAGNGIWLLGRDLSTKYIGADVEEFTTGATVMSAVNIPGTNEVRFTLSSGVTIVFNYFFNRWSSSSNIQAVSSTLFQGVHAYVNSSGMAYQETPGVYLDGGSPVLISLTTGWIGLAGLQGYQRAYCFYLLGTYLSPHKLQIQIAYDYNPSPSQSFVIAPVNYAAAYGVDTPYGAGTPYGGPGNLEQWQINFKQQKCQAFQISINEIYDPSYGVAAGGGLVLSGLNIVYGQKKGYAKIAANLSTG